MPLSTSGNGESDDYSECEVPVRSKRRTGLESDEGPALALASASASTLSW